MKGIAKIYFNKYIINILTNQEEEENNHQILFNLTVLPINFVYHNRCRGGRG